MGIFNSFIPGLLARKTRKTLGSIFQQRRKKKKTLAFPVASGALTRPKPRAPFMFPRPKAPLTETKPRQVLRTAKEFSAVPALTRAAISFGKQAKEEVTGVKTTPFRAKSNLGRFLLEPSPDFEGVKTPDKRIDEAQAKGRQLTKTKAGTAEALVPELLASTVGLPLLGLVEQIPGGGSKKKLIKELAERIAARHGDDVAGGLVKEFGDDFATKFAKKSDAEIDKIIKQTKIQTKPAISTKEAVPTKPATPPRPKELSSPTIDAETALQSTKKIASEPRLAREAQQHVGVNEVDGFDPFDYVKEIQQKQKAARVGPIKNASEKVKGVFTDFKRKIIDSNAPIEDAIRKAQKDYNFSVRPEFDLTNQIDRALRAPTLAGQFAKDKGFVNLTKNVDNIDNLDQYLIAKQARDVSARGINTGRDAAKDVQLVEAFEGKYEGLAKQVNKYSQDLLDEAVSSGLVNKELADSLKKQYPNYVPLNRVFSEVEKAGQFTGIGGSTSISSQSILQRLKGSDREIESPIASLLSKTNDVFMQGERNKAARILSDYRNLPGMNELIKEIPPGQTAKHTISFLEDGVKKTFEVTQELEQAAKSLNPQQLNFLQKVVAFPVRLAKLGITGLNLPFIGSNIARDQLFGAITSQHTRSVANPSVFLRALTSAAKHDELYEQLVRSGGGGTSFDIARDQAPQTVKNIRSSRTKLGKFKYLVKNPGELLRAIEDIVGRSEEVTRIQQFEGTKKTLLKQGRTPEDAAILAAKAARENTANFLRRGEWGGVLNSTFLYINAGIQGQRAFFRALKRDPKKTLAKLTVGLLTPMAATTAWNIATPERRAAYQDIPDYEKENNLIIIPPNPTQDDRGRWNVIKIPLPPGLSALTIPVRKGLEVMQDVDDVAFQDVVKTLTGPVIPIDVSSKEGVFSSLTPQALKPGVEAFTNKNFFTGKDIVPSNLEKLSPELQTFPWTSATARKIGGVLSVSPIKVESFIKGTAGGVGLQGLNATDRALAGLNIIPEEEIGGQDLVDAITARFTKASGGKKGDKAVEEIQNILQGQDDDRFILKQEAEVIYADLSKMPGAEANQKMRELKVENRKLWEKVRKVNEEIKLDLNYEERLIKQLGVTNGERANFLFNLLSQMPTGKEKNAAIREWERKKIVSKNVRKQIGVLISQSTSK